MAKKISSRIFLSALVVFVMLGTVLYFTVMRVQDLTPIEESPQAQTSETVLSILTFNYVSTPAEATACMDDIVRMVKDKNVDIIAFQEAQRARDDDEEGRRDVDWHRYLRNRLIQEYAPVEDFFSSTGNLSSSITRGNSLYIKDTLTVVDHEENIEMPHPDNDYRSFNWVKLRVPEGEFYVANIHPTYLNSHPGDWGAQQHNFINAYMDTNQGSRPRVVLGDFNYDFTQGWPSGNYYLDNYIRGCDPAVNPACHDTVRDAQVDSAIDHIMLQKWNSSHRGTSLYWRVIRSEVLNTVRPAACSPTGPGYETDFSHHFPVLVQVAVSNNSTLPDPTGLSHTCNSNGTATFRWNSVSGAGEYAFRLDHQGTNPNNPIHNWPTIPPDVGRHITNTSITESVTPGTYYQWAVTAVSTPGDTHSFPNWRPAFTCAAPTVTRVPTSIPIPGDTNGDGSISASELRAILQKYYSNTASLDTNRDGMVNSIDYIFIHQYIR